MDINSLQACSGLTLASSTYLSVGGMHHASCILRL